MQNSILTLHDFILWTFDTHSLKSISVSDPSDNNSLDKQTLHLKDEENVKNKVLIRLISFVQVGEDMITMGGIFTDNLTYSILLSEMDLHQNSCFTLKTNKGNTGSS